MKRVLKALLDGLLITVYISIVIGPLMSSIILDVSNIYVLLACAWTLFGVIAPLACIED